MPEVNNIDGHLNWNDLVDGNYLDQGILTPNVSYTSGDRTSYQIKDGINGKDKVLQINPLAGAQNALFSIPTIPVTSQDVTVIFATNLSSWSNINTINKIFFTGSSGDNNLYLLHYRDGTNKTKLTVTTKGVERINPTPTSYATANTWYYWKIEFLLSSYTVNWKVWDGSSWNTVTSGSWTGNSSTWFAEDIYQLVILRVWGNWTSGYVWLSNMSISTAPGYALTEDPDNNSDTFTNIWNYNCKPLRQDLYHNGTFIFNDRLTGSSPTEFPPSTVGKIYSSIEDGIYGRNKVMKVYCNDTVTNYGVSNKFTGRSSGTVEFWYLTTATNKYAFDICLHGASNPHTYFMFWNDGYIKYYDKRGATNGWLSLRTYSENTWIHVKFVFNCNTKIITIYIDDVSYGPYNFSFDNGTDVAEFLIGSSIQSAETCYLSGIDYSWSSGYSDGRNKSLVALDTYSVPQQYKPLGKTNRRVLSMGVPIKDYNAEYSFETDTLGATPSGWTTSGTVTATVVRALGDHSRVMKVNLGASGAYVINTFPVAQATGTIEFWVYPTSATGNQFYFVVEDSSASYYDMMALWTDSGKFYARDSSGWVELQTYSANTWYHVKFICYANTYDVYIDGTIKANGISHHETSGSMGRIRIVYQSVATVYFDAIDYSWSPEYFEGRNKTWDVRYKDYNGAYSFTTDTLNAAPSGFTDGSAASCNIKVIRALGDHSRVLQFYDGHEYNSAIATKSFGGSKTTGTYEVWLRTTNVNYRNLIVLDDKSWLYIGQTAGKWEYWDGALKGIPNVADPINDTWYHVKCTWNATTGKITYVINDVSSGELNMASASAPTQMTFLTAYQNQPNPFYMYIDALDFSWESGYYDGRNKTWS